MSAASSRAIDSSLFTVRYRNSGLFVDAHTGDWLFRAGVLRTQTLSTGHPVHVICVASLLSLYQNSVSQLSMQINALNRQFSSTVHSMEEAAKRSTHRIRRLKKQLQSARIELEGRTNLYQRAKKDSERIEKQLKNNYEKSIAQLRKDFETAHNNEAELAIAQAQLERLTTEFTLSKAKLETSTDELTTTRAQLKKLTAECTQIKAQLKSSTDELTKAKAELQQSTTELITTKAQLTLLQARLSKYSEQQMTQRKRATALRSLPTQNTSRPSPSSNLLLNRANDDLQQKKTCIVILQKQIQELKAELQRAKETQATLGLNYTRLQTKYESLMKNQAATNAARAQRPSSKPPKRQRSQLDMNSSQI